MYVWFSYNNNFTSFAYEMSVFRRYFGYFFYLLSRCTIQNAHITFLLVDGNRKELKNQNVNIKIIEALRAVI